MAAITRPNAPPVVRTWVGAGRRGSSRGRCGKAPRAAMVDAPLVSFDGAEGGSVKVDVCRRKEANDGSFDVTLTAADREGLLSAVTEALTSIGASISAANVTTKDDTANNTFLVKPSGDSLDEDVLRQAVLMAVLGKYLPSSPEAPSPAEFEGEPDDSDVQVMRFDAMPENMLVVVVEGVDRVGLLASISKVFSDLKLSVQSAEITTTDYGTVRNRFAVLVEEDAPAFDAIKEAVLEAVDGLAPIRA